MPKYEFSVLASGIDPEADDFESRFYNAGCHDATIAVQKGYIILDFTRTATSINEALSSAIHDIRRAGATIERVEPDPLVNLSDIAERSGLTRSAASLFANGQRGDGFPRPVAKITAKHSLWKWAQVARWLCRRRHLPEERVAEADAIAHANDEISRGQGRQLSV